jgi:hypothetical protein
MKIALYIENGLEQIVLTPETDTEKGIVGKLHDGSRTVSIKKGSFFECLGGYIRNGASDDSTMIVLHRIDSKAPEPPR